MKNDGGYAFPFAHEQIADLEGGKQTRGMSLRDYFAAKAMHGILCHYGQMTHYKDIGEWSYEIADGMLKEREK